MVVLQFENNSCSMFAILLVHSFENFRGKLPGGAEVFTEAHSQENLRRFWYKEKNLKENSWRSSTSIPAFREKLGKLRGIYPFILNIHHFPEYSWLNCKIRVISTEIDVYTGTFAERKIICEIITWNQVRITEMFDKLYRLPLGK